MLKNLRRLDVITSIVCLIGAFVILTCGGIKEPKYKRHTEIEQMPPQIRAIVDRRCATSGCHINGRIVDVDSSGSALKESGSGRSIRAGRMPKSGSSENEGFKGSADEKALLEYIGS